MSRSRERHFGRPLVVVSGAVVDPGPRPAEAKAEEIPFPKSDPRGPTPGALGLEGGVDWDPAGEVVAVEEGGERTGVLRPGERGAGEEEGDGEQKRDPMGGLRFHGGGPSGWMGKSFQDCIARNPPRQGTGVAGEEVPERVGETEKTGEGRPARRLRSRRPNSPWHSASAEVGRCQGGASAHVLPLGAASFGVVDRCCFDVCRTEVR